MSKDKKVEKIRPQDIILKISNQTGINPETVAMILGATEDVVAHNLSSVSESGDMSIKLFDGFFIDGEYQSAKVRENNLTGEEIEIAAKIKVKGRFTRNFEEKLNQHLKVIESME